jgi:2-oxoglutarate dehydrogenase complex dehydrogenase (E1) component-like enzyme
VRASTARGLHYVGRTWKASPSEGYPTVHQVEQDRIVRAALSTDA